MRLDPAVFNEFSLIERTHESGELGSQYEEREREREKNWRRRRRASCQLALDITFHFVLREIRRQGGRRVPLFINKE